MKQDRRKKWSRWIILFSIILMIFGNTTVYASDRIAEGVELSAGRSDQSEKEVLRIGFDGSTVPCSWVQDTADNNAIPITGTEQYLAGFEIEYIQRICDIAGYEIEAYRYDWDGLMMAVSSGKVDAAMAMIAPTEDRLQTMDFTDPYYYADTVAVVRKDSVYAGATSLEDLDGVRATSMLNTLWYNYQLDHIPNVQKTEALENVPTMVVAVQAGTVDLVLLDRPTAEGVVGANPELTICNLKTGDFNTSREETAVAIALHKGRDDLKERLNAAIAIVPTEEIDAMIDRACEYQPLENTEQDIAVMSFGEMVGFITRKYLPLFLQGAAVAAFLAIGGTAFGTIIGCVTGSIASFSVDQESTIVRRIVFHFVQGAVSLYVWLFRGTPMMVQAMVIFYGAAQLLHWNMNPMWAGLFILSVNTGAYMSETMRGGIQSVDPGQHEGAEALGMNRFQTTFLVILPQAFRSIAPQIGNYLISNIKDTSMLSVITVGELFYCGRQISGQYFRFFEVFLIVSVIYLVLTSLATILLHLIERQMANRTEYDLTEV
ncbi:MAG: ABC transporter substrate-binding protein/permease [Clostridiales bacterium]|nr:ABC transporter substrate-binding protein/permease [Clostridiales bacterium]